MTEVNAWHEKYISRATGLPAGACAVNAWMRTRAPQGAGAPAKRTRNRIASAQEKKALKTAPSQSAAKTGRRLKSLKRMFRGVFSIGQRLLKIPAQAKCKNSEDA